MEYTKKQSEFLCAVEMGRNVYLSGFAGTGKSTIAIEAMDRLKAARRKFIALAPTGRAANNINGETVHSMFRINPYGCIMEMEDCNFINKQKMMVLKKAETIIIDEISMCRADLIDAMHMTLIRNGISNGLKSKQIIFIGDLGQLPPIASKNEMTVLLSKYDDITFLDAIITKELNLLHIDLDEIVRQTDIEFIEALRILREGGKAEYFKRLICKEPSGVILAAHNATVNSYNERGLNSQAGEVFTFDATIDGPLKAEDFSLEAQIKVKDGCKIMYLVNSKDNPLRNGTIGEFSSRKTDKGLALFFKYNNTEFPIELYTAHKKEYVYNRKSDAMELEDKGSIEQYPFKLAYALSIHKSQGMTFDDMTVDLRRRPFIKQQYYVAFSRATGPKALRIIV